MIDVDPPSSANRPLELGIAGDIDVILRQLTAALPRGLESRSASWRAELRRREGEARAKLVELAATDQAPISHYRWAWEIACAVTRDTIVVGDGGDVVNCAAKFVPIDRMGQWMDPGPLGCLGVGPSFALAAKLLRPDQRVLLVSGDGAFGLNGMELETAVRFKLPFTCVIGNDGGWGQIRSPQVSFFGEGRTVATSLPTTRYDLMVEALGGRGAYVTDPSQIGPVLARALASDESGASTWRRPGGDARAARSRWPLTAVKITFRARTRMPAGCARSTYADLLTADGHQVTVVVPRRRGRAFWRSVTGAGPTGSPLRARVVGRSMAATRCRMATRSPRRRGSPRPLWPRHRRCGRKFYFVQHYEPLSRPGGDGRRDVSSAAQEDRDLHVASRHHA
jgi:hypothetical protein